MAIARANLHNAITRSHPRAVLARVRAVLAAEVAMVGCAWYARPPTMRAQGSNEHSTSDVLARELRRGEELRWRGRPVAGVRLHASDAVPVAFLAAWCSGALALSIRASSVLGLLFLALGGSKLVQLVFVDAVVRARTVYALTDYRALIVSGLIGRQVRSVDLRMITEVGLTEMKSGVGTLTFGPHLLSGRSRRVTSAQFRLIPDARAVYQQVLDIQAAFESTNSDEDD